MIREDNEAARILLSPPGDTITETMQAKGISSEQLAFSLSLPEEQVEELLKGKTALTPEIALQLEQVLQVPSDFWLKREELYRQELKQIE